MKASTATARSIICWTLLLLATASTVSASELCCLCNGCQRMARGRATLQLDSNGHTCLNKYMELVDKYAVNSPQCLHGIAHHRPRCCDPDHEPVEIVQAPTLPPEQVSFPPCDLCPAGTSPKTPFKPVRALKRFLPGVHTCKTVVEMGRNGLIDEQICNPFGDFIQRECGCSQVGKSKPSTSIGWAANPTASPTAMPPTNGPEVTTISPELYPTEKPTSAPTQRSPFAPTGTPTDVPTVKATTSASALYPTESPMTAIPTTEPSVPPTALATSRPTSIPTSGPPTVHPTIEVTTSAPTL